MESHHPHSFRGTPSPGKPTHSSAVKPPNNNDLPHEQDNTPEGVESRRKGGGVADYREVYSQLSTMIRSMDEAMAAQVEKHEMDFLVAYRVSCVDENGVETYGQGAEGSGIAEEEAE